MTLSPAQLQTDLPEFADSDAYPDAVLSTWLTVASNLVNDDRWGNLAQIGTELCAAHFIVLATRDQAAASKNTEPGKVTGPQTSKAVGDVSASYDVSSVTMADGGFWNQTNYGIRFRSLARLMGAGGMQLGGCSYSYSY